MCFLVFVFVVVVCRRRRRLVVVVAVIIIVVFGIIGDCYCDRFFEFE